MLAESTLRQPLSSRLSKLDVLLILLAVSTMPVQAQTCDRVSVQDRPRIGLALGGGGARGGAHIGVLRMLEELRVPLGPTTPTRSPRATANSGMSSLKSPSR